MSLILNSSVGIIELSVLTSRNRAQNVPPLLGLKVNTTRALNRNHSCKIWLVVVQGHNIENFICKSLFSLPFYIDANLIAGQQDDKRSLS
jgi:hypothetical protein